MLLTTPPLLLAAFEVEAEVASPSSRRRRKGKGKGKGKGKKKGKGSKATKNLSEEQREQRKWERLDRKRRIEDAKQAAAATLINAMGRGRKVRRWFGPWMYRRKMAVQFEYGSWLVACLTGQGDVCA